MAPPIGGGGKKRAAADAGDDIAARLEAHGERFLAAFAGGGGKSRSAPVRTPVEREVKAARAAARLAKDVAAAAAAEEAPEPAGNALEALFARGGDGSASRSAMGAAPASRAPAPAPAVATAVFDGRRVTSYAPGAAPPPLPPPPPKRKRGERAVPGSADEDAELKRAFKAIEKEVELFGAAGLEAREKKAWEAKRLVSLGMHAPKRPRVPAFIGFGMAAKAAQREEAARLEEAAVNGGKLAKKKAKATGAAGSGKVNVRERGVAWGGGTDSFRGGMLHLAAPPRDGGGGGGGGFSGGFAGVFKSGGGGGKHGKGGGKKGGKGKGKGGKR